MKGGAWRLRKTRALADDARHFLELLPALAGWFDPKAPLVTARAPGRLDLMGGIADYSGSLVLEMPLSCATFVAAQWTPGRRCEARSTAAETLQLWDTGFDLSALLGDYDLVAARFADVPGQHWAAYVLGALTVLAREREVELTRGIRVFVHSDVPAGRGLASSAALEVATLRAVCGLLELEITDPELALLAQKVENHVARAPCGVMDQMTSACGEPQSCLALLCQPAEIQGHVRLPAGIEVWGIDSGESHAVSGSDYTAVRIGTFMGYRILADLARLPVEPLEPGRVHVEDWLWDGWLVNVGPEAWINRYRNEVPARLRGSDFLARYGGTTDAVTRVDPAATYSVRRPTEHAILEHARVRAFHDRLLHTPLRDEDCEQLGAWMYESHHGYDALGLGSDGTDLLVELVHEAGLDAGLFGARVTGGGSGGTVAVLARKGSSGAVRAIASDYLRRTGRGGDVVSGSSMLTPAYGVLELAPPGASPL